MSLKLLVIGRIAIAGGENIAGVGNAKTDGVVRVWNRQFGIGLAEFVVHMWLLVEPKDDGCLLQTIAGGTRSTAAKGARTRWVLALHDLTKLLAKRGVLCVAQFEHFTARAPDDDAGMVAIPAKHRLHDAAVVRQSSWSVGR